jgi:type VI secretion system protein ImpD
VTLSEQPSVSFRGVRARSLEAVAGGKLDAVAGVIDSWMALDDTASALIAWFGDALPRDRQGLVLALERDVAEIDAVLSAQVDAILHARAFQRLEASWRGVHYLSEVAEGAPLAKLVMLPLSWNELVRDLQRAADFDQSQLYRKIYTEGLGVLGGEPFGLLVCDYEIRHRQSADHPTDDIAALKSLATIAAAAFAPVILGVSPALFQVASFGDLGKPFDLQAVFRQIEYQRWRSIRDQDEMRFVGLAMPRILMRLPYGFDTERRDGFRYEERVASPADHLWGNAAFAFASVALRAFANFGWFADIRGTPDDEVRGGLLADLPVPSFASDAPGVAIKPSIECSLSDTQEKDLAELGFIALRRVQYTSYSAFYANQSVQAPAPFNDPAARMNARLSCMLQYTLCVSRFAHYVKLLGRNFIGSMMSAEDCEHLLHQWLLNHCEGSDDARLETKARYPLREASIEVREIPGRSGAYSCKLFLRPHFQLDDIVSGFHLVTQLSPPTVAA